MYIVVTHQTGIELRFNTYFVSTHKIQLSTKIIAMGESENTFSKSYMVFARTIAARFNPSTSREWVSFLDTFEAQVSDAEAITHTKADSKLKLLLLTKASEGEAKIFADAWRKERRAKLHQLNTTHADLEVTLRELNEASEREKASEGEHNPLKEEMSRAREEKKAAKKLITNFENEDEYSLLQKAVQIQFPGGTNSVLEKEQKLLNTKPNINEPLSQYIVRISDLLSDYEILCTTRKILPRFTRKQPGPETNTLITTLLRNMKGSPWQQMLQITPHPSFSDLQTQISILTERTGETGEIKVIEDSDMTNTNTISTPQKKKYSSSSCSYSERNHGTRTTECK